MYGIVSHATETARFEIISIEKFLEFNQAILISVKQEKEEAVKRIEQYLIKAAEEARCVAMITLSPYHWQKCYVTIRRFSYFG